jgi:methionine aminopeptidase
VFRRSIYKSQAELRSMLAAGAATAAALDEARRLLAPGVTPLELDAAAERPYGADALGSKYQGQVGPTPSEYWRNFDR